MLGDISAATNIYIVTGYTDMRKSIDGLCAIVYDQLQTDMPGQSIYMFCGKRCDRIKVLFHGKRIALGEHPETMRLHICNIMDSLTHNVRRANWLNIINQCQERSANVTVRQWLKDNDINEK